MRRKPADEIRWVQATFTRLPIQWSSEMAYLVGLTATDGCLIESRRAINFKSADRELVELYLALLGRTNKVGVGKTQFGGVVFKTQFGDTRLYGWLESIGLTPRKSLTLGAIAVPDDYLAPLVRGLLDGDGNITNGTWKADTTRRSDYFYDWLRVRFYSASRAHLEWLKSRLAARLALRGWITFNSRRGNGVGALGYGKHDSIRLLSWLYSDQAAPCLERKRAIWQDYRLRYPDVMREPPSTISA